MHELQLNPRIGIDRNAFSYITMRTNYKLKSTNNINQFHFKKGVISY